MGTVQSNQQVGASHLGSGEFREALTASERLSSDESAAEPPKAQASEVSVSEARSALVDCVLDSSYKWCTLGILLAVPVGVLTKSYNSLVYFGMSGTLFDFYEGYYNCQQQRRAYEDAQKRAKDLDS